MPAKTKVDTQLALLMEEIRSSRGSPASEGAGAVEDLAAYLAGQEPSPVRLHHLPNWLRQAWVRHRPAGTLAHYGSPSGWSVAMEMDSWLASTGDAWHLDHWGSTTIAGVPCFVSEPYRTIEEAKQQVEALSAVVGCVGLGLPRGNWHKGTVRVLLIPRPPFRRKLCGKDDSSYLKKGGIPYSR